MRVFHKDALEVRVYDDRAALGRAAAAAVAARISEVLAGKPEVNIVFAAAPSQNEFLAALVEMELDWGRVNGFHMDEYVGLAADAPQGFGNFLKAGLFGRVPFGRVYYLGGDSQQYAQLLLEYPTDIVALGIGENTHLAFNDPHVARFDDPVLVKTVDLDEACRQQQVHDGCFETLEQVPTHALTLTIPALMRARFVYAIVPGARKAEAVAHTLEDEISERYPSTILRRHPNAVLFIEKGK
jgi:glucosamine-6-phosphate deaminase